MRGQSSFGLIDAITPVIEEVRTRSFIRLANLADLSRFGARPRDSKLEFFGTVCRVSKNSRPPSKMLLAPSEAIGLRVSVARSALIGSSLPCAAPTTWAGIERGPRRRRERC